MAGAAAGTYPNTTSEITATVEGNDIHFTTALGPIGAWIKNGSVLIDGDGDAGTGTLATASHVYADGPAAYTIQATATNAAGTFAANTVAVTVNNVDATLTAGTVSAGVTSGTLALPKVEVYR